MATAPEGSGAVTARLALLNSESVLACGLKFMVTRAHSHAEYFRFHAAGNTGKK